MLQIFFGYVKGDDESIDRMASTLKQMSDDIYDLAPEARLSDNEMASVIMNACQGEEYNMAKFTLSHVDVLTDFSVGRGTTPECRTERSEGSFEFRPLERQSWWPARQKRPNQWLRQVKCQVLWLRHYGTF